MGKFYTLKDFVHEQKLTMDEFRRLDKETQEKWRQIHQRKLKEKLKERDEWLDEFSFKHEFLPLKHVNPDTFDDLAEWKQEEWRKQFKEWKKWNNPQNSKHKTQKELDKEETEYCMQLLADCGVPFGPDGPLGI